MPTEQFGNRNGPTDRRAELVALQDGDRLAVEVVKKRVGIKRVVAHKLKQAAVYLIGAGFRDYTDDAGAIPAILGGIVAREKTELGYLVRIRQEDRIVIEDVVVEAAIEQIGNRIRPSSR